MLAHTALMHKGVWLWYRGKCYRADWEQQRTLQTQVAEWHGTLCQYIATERKSWELLMRTPSTAKVILGLLVKSKHGTLGFVTSKF